MEDRKKEDQKRTIVGKRRNTVHYLRASNVGNGGPVNGGPLQQSNDSLKSA